MNMMTPRHPTGRVLGSREDEPPDAYSEAGARRLAAKITAYWAQRGRTVDVAIRVERGGRNGPMWVVEMPKVKVPVLAETTTLPTPPPLRGRTVRMMPWHGWNARILAASILVPGGGRAPATPTTEGPRVMLPPGWGTRVLGLPSLGEKS